MSQTDRQSSANAHREQMRLAMSRKLRDISSDNLESARTENGRVPSIPFNRGDAAQGGTRRPWIYLLCALALILCPLIWVAARSSPEREALEAWCAPPALDARRYPRLGIAVNERGWLRATASAPDGPALFTVLRDPLFSAPIVVEHTDWREVLTILNGMSWNGSSWVASALSQKPGGRMASRTVGEIREILARTIHDERAVRAIIALLSGVPTGSAPDFARRLLQEGKAPARLRLLSFSGRNGVHAVAIGRPEYKMVDRAYSGVLLQFDDADWPSEWRVLELAPAEPP